VKTSMLVILTFSLLISGSQAKAADPQPTSDTWYVYVDEETQYASQHVAKRTLASGNTEYRIDSRVLYDLLGNRQEETTDATYVVTPDFAPVSARVHTTRASGEVEITGEIDGDHFIIRRESNGLRRSSTIDLTQRPIFRATLPDALSRLENGPHAPEAVLAVIDEVSLRVEPAKCCLLESNDSSAVVWSVEVGSDVVLEKGHLTLTNGEREREVFSMPQYTLRRSSRQEAGQIKHLTLEGRDMLMFDVDKPIARIDLLQELTMKLRWKDVPLNRLHLIDGRQTLVSHKAEGQQHEAVVRIVNPDSSSPQSVEQLTQDEREKLLGKTRFIDPKDDEIVAKSIEWTKDCLTTREIVAALTENVSTYLRGSEAIAETLSGPEVLKCRKGKCSEYAILLASLARSQKIPTRIVLGDRMVSGQWIGHMWNEVFIDEDEANADTAQRPGRWITVDATTNEIGSAPGLLKFTHSDSVYGTQQGRWDLTDSLELSIVTYSMKPDISPEAWQTGIEENTYTSGEFGFRISAPGNDWKLVPKLKAGLLEMRLHVPDDDRVLLHCVAFSLPVAVDTTTIMTARSTRFQLTYKNYESLADEAVDLSGNSWQLLQFRRDMGPEGKKAFPDGNLIKTTEYAICRGNVGYLINLIAEESIHDKYADRLEEVVKSVVFK
jgi:hypothetical protein